MQCILFSERVEWLTLPGIDQLDDPDKIIAASIDHGGDQHLLGAISGAAVHLHKKAQFRMMRAQLFLVVYILDIYQLLG